MDTDKIKHLCEALWKVEGFRSITGQGLRNTYDMLDSVCKLNRMEFPTGMEIGDWTIPKEWVFRKATIKAKGELLISTDDSKLHIASYSTPFKGKVSIEELEKHVFTHTYIPYRTLYFDNDWAFCMTEEDWERISVEFDEVEVEIDSELVNGKVDVAYREFEGKSDKNYLFSAYCCHPQTANNGISGMAINILLAEYVESLKDRKHNYTFVFCPETIGSIAFLSMDFKNYERGFMIHCCGAGAPPQEYPHYPGYGGDDRQYELAGVSMASIMTALPEQYFQYHTSGDDLEFLDYPTMEIILGIHKEYIDFFEANFYPKRQFNHEPCLEKHDIELEDKEERRQFMRVWAASDGTNDLFDIFNNEKYSVPRGKILRLINIMKEKNLLAN